MSQSVANLIRQSTATYYFELSLCALLCYEYCITLEYEVLIGWRRRVTATSALFMLNRCVMLCTVATGILSFLLSIADTSQGCKKIFLVQQAFALLGVAEAAFFSALRISALYDRNCVLFLGVFILAIVPIVTNAFGSAELVFTIAVQPPYGHFCAIKPHIDKELNTIMLWVTRIPAILADILVLYFTWARTWRHIQRAREVGLRVPLSFCILRDGTVYFLASLLLNVIQLAADLGFLPSIALADFLETYPAVQTILIGRFLINLRGDCDVDSYGREYRSSMCPSLHGADSRRLGNIGCSLRFASDDVAEPVE